ncbi:F-box domain-containing protein [Mycena kentingensis (nom. inval.)]|nr:F-box domain-containing protein [Mycena kentingensis (nom. inval.)]
MGSGLLALPLDILHTIAVELDAPSILNLAQTCRVLHAYVLTADYIWHRLHNSNPLPLNIEPYADVAQMPAAACKAATCHALRVDQNWRRVNPSIRQMTRIPDMDNVSQMQLIGSSLLVVLRRFPASISIWRVTHKRAQRVAFLDLPDASVPLKFAATIQNDEVLVALISAMKSGAQLTAYSVALSDETSFSPAALKQACNIVSKDSVFYEVHVYAHLIAVGIHSTTNPRIMLVNALTRAQCTMNPHLPEGVTQLHLKLVGGATCQLVLTGILNQSLLIRVHDLPEDGVNDLASPCTEYRSPVITDFADYTLCVDSTHPFKQISALSFHTLTSRAPDDYYLRFPKEKACIVHRFATHTSASAEIVCLGETGTRAVWLERRWANDQYTLMKAVFGAEEWSVQPLLGRHLALPFELEKCQCLAFDEATGQVSIAFHREIYVLGF